MLTVNTPMLKSLWRPSRRPVARGAITLVSLTVYAVLVAIVVSAVAALPVVRDYYSIQETLKSEIYDLQNEPFRATIKKNVIDTMRQKHQIALTVDDIDVERGRSGVLTVTIRFDRTLDFRVYRKTIRLQAKAISDQKGASTRMLQAQAF